MIDTINTSTRSLAHIASDATGIPARIANDGTGRHSATQPALESVAVEGFERPAETGMVAGRVRDNLFHV